MPLTRRSYFVLAVALACLLALPTPVTATADASFADSLQSAYAAHDVEAVRGLLDRANSPAQQWMARYRLYPLTEDEDALGDPPSDPEDVADASAQTLAVLSGIWAYKAGETNLFNAMRYGRRSMNFLEAAQARDADDPYVLLVEGQSLMFRPSIAGKDVGAAIDRFRSLVDVLTRTDEAGIAMTEAKTWLWLALKEDGRADEAASLHDSLLAAQPAPLYRQFLKDPPQV